MKKKKKEKTNPNILWILVANISKLKQKL